MPIRDQNALNERAKRLEGNSLNGIKFVLVTLTPNQNPTKAILEVHFFNTKNIGSLVNDPNFKKIFTISGGHRILAGHSVGQVQVTSVSQGPDDYSLTLTVEPIGDYSTYALIVNSDVIDPLLDEIDFKFRPGCFNIDCSPEWSPALKPEIEPVIDYLAKDFDSFRHTLITAMMERIPGWQPTSEADLDVVLLELFSAATDELSDYQDRVMNEAYLDTARKRVSLARHARLMDYHIHQGNQASTWLAIKIAENKAITLDKGFKDSVWIGFEVWTGGGIDDPSSVVFINKEEQELYPSINEMHLYTWDDAIPTLAAGDTTADLVFETQEDAEKVLELINKEDPTKKVPITQYLLIQERLNPDTGLESGRDPNHRQILKLLGGGKGAVLVKDTLNANKKIVRVFWEEKDKLKSNYCFTIKCSSGKVKNVSLFYGNLIRVFHGFPTTGIFDSNDIHTERGAICRLRDGPLVYMDTPPGGDIPPQSTLGVEILTKSGTNPWAVLGGPWIEVSNLIHSHENDSHFVVETDENGQSIIRFGDGTNGKKLPQPQNSQDSVKVTCNYQIGSGPDGNIGADRLNNFDKTTFPGIRECWNPFDVTNGRDPEPVEEIIRRVPEAYRFKQLRAITLKDYVDMVEKIPGVSKASARYMWTGSWRTVQIAVDPAGMTTLDQVLKRTIATYLDAVKLIGEDYEIRPPKYVPLEIHVTFCVHPDYWSEYVRTIVEQEFSEGYTPDGRIGFFHPDLWTFGQELRASQIIGRVQSIKGVDYVVNMHMSRWNEVTPGNPGIIKVRPNEIIQVKNDPDDMEQGLIDFKAEGGRQ